MTELELKQLRLLSEQFLSFAELKVSRKQEMKMADWLIKLDDFIRTSDLEVLENAGRISKDLKERVVKRVISAGREKMQQALDQQAREISSNNQKGEV